MNRAAGALTFVAIAGWMTSLLLPALSFRFDGERDQILEGYKVLTSGYFHLLVLEFSWLANFAFWYLVLVLLRWPERRRTIQIGAVITLLLTLQSVEIFIFDRFFQFPRAYPGYYVWVGSNIVLCVAAVFAMTGARLDKSRRPR